MPRLSKRVGASHFDEGGNVLRVKDPPTITQAPMFPNVYPTDTGAGSPAAIVTGLADAVVRFRAGRNEHVSATVEGAARTVMLGRPGIGGRNATFQSIFAGEVGTDFGRLDTVRAFVKSVEGLEFSEKLDRLGKSNIDGQALNGTLAAILDPSCLHP